MQRRHSGYDDLPRGEAGFGLFGGRKYVNLVISQRYRQVVEDIANLNWPALSRDDLLAVAWAYYYFSVQFRENLELACEMNPWDELLTELRAGECDTSNLSPYPGVADRGEKMNHDEFMRRLLGLSELHPVVRTRVQALGVAYLAFSRSVDPTARALSISSYEDGGLEAVFRAILLAPDWSDASLAAFKHFLVEHIRFDSDVDAGHGALSRHLVPDDRIYELWDAFRNLLVGAAPVLLS
jgi:hypothetical protein